jgi:predicted O-methyltransferase YrrM
MKYNLIHKLFRYLIYRFHAKNRYDIHSPFVYEFMTKVLNNRKKLKSYREIEMMRKELNKNQDLIDVTDFGAGNKRGDSGMVRRKINSLASDSAVRPRYGQLLLRISEWLRPKTILELGTSLGFGSMYLAQGAPGASITTIEGSPAIAARAKKNFEHLRASNIRLMVGRFDDILPELLKESDDFDLVYIDGNHQYKATLLYFNMLHKRIRDNSLIIFDDIHWSMDMEKAWSEICSRPEVTVSIDLFQFGLVFFSKRLSKQHFILKF